jgi:uncharacterized protein (TIGR02757 family)
MHMQLKVFLDKQVNRFNRPDFIAPDPIAIPHRFSAKEDIEISGFMTALLAWGQRPVILRNAWQLMERMDLAPAAFVRGHSRRERQGFRDFVHRTFNGADAISLLKALQELYQDEDGLEGAFTGAWQAEQDLGAAIHRLRSRLLKGSPARFAKHIADPLSGSAAKRICMFLRWMVRRDACGVDFGIWRAIPPSALACPLDLHSGRVARELGLLQRSQNDWKAVQELTAALSRFDAADPVKYDFALFGLGVNEGK